MDRDWFCTQNIASENQKRSHPKCWVQTELMASFNHNALRAFICCFHRGMSLLEGFRRIPPPSPPSSPNRKLPPQVSRPQSTVVEKVSKEDGSTTSPLTSSPQPSRRHRRTVKFLQRDSTLHHSRLWGQPLRSGAQSWERTLTSTARPPHMRPRCTVGVPRPRPSAPWQVCGMSTGRKCKSTFFVCHTFPVIFAPPRFKFRVS